MLNLIGVIIAFIVILVLIRKKVNFGLSLLLGSLIVGIFSLEVTAPIDIPKAMIEASFYSFEKQQIITETIELALLMTLIFILAKCMQETGAITKLSNSLRTFFSRGGTLGVVPAVYGLMNIPGGALFSAPFVDREGDKYNLNKDQKNFLNVWFRHIWFPIFPISQAVIIICSASFSDIPIELLIVADIPVFIAFVVIGFLFLRRYTGKVPKTVGSLSKDYTGLVFLLPPTVPLLFYFLIFLGFSEISSFIIGVLVGIFVLFLLLKTSVRQSLTFLKKSLTWRLALAIFAIMIFRQMVEISQIHVLLAQLMQNLAFPALLMIIAIPFVLGLLSGSDFGGIALSYVLIQPFFIYTGINIVGLSSIILMSSLVGYLISPIHLCNVLSSEYLKTDITRMYRMLLPAIVALLCVQVVFSIIVFSA